ncbi:YdcF family protein [Leptolyngbya sp. FACHB-711]|uniref:YdcF family protein n=1 Tax=unclassified Leptolyngbya TaxID=2650499 RepID=UPI00168451B8|nr:YdcF family protein [Leptolyngbya sp. FACHB-711]MBD1851042.1 YdcF family protein [Cyanobacteria bacterium FACHB-502]MBD2026875.1 YdcF family protein [Leptolyngbya sp. FACHB-711]
MFLFFSKLLPLLIYPLGLSCFLLIIALFTVWKRPRLTAGCIGLALALLLLTSNRSVSAALVRSLEQQYLPPANLPTAEAIVVLGGATKSQSPPRPWIDVMEAGDRPIHGARLYLEGKAPLVILSGGRISWQGGGDPESADMAKLVEALGVPRSAIVQDPTSLNTRENAVNVKQLLQSRRINRILLVTSAMHMPRSIQIFKKLGIEALPAPTDFLIADQEFAAANGSSEARLLSLLPDIDGLYGFTRALKEYIGIVVYRLRGWL